jgi:hypothetical protein
MKQHSSTRWIVFAIAALLLLLPGASEVYESPYGLRPVALWVAVAMLSIGYLALFAATDLLVQRAARLGSAARLVGGAVFMLLLFVALPLVGLAAVAAITFASSAAEADTLASAALAQKYLHHFALAPMLSAALISAPAVVVFSLLSSHPGRAQHQAANAA